MSTKHIDLVRLHADPTIQADERSSFDRPTPPIDQFPRLFAELGWDANQGSPIVFAPTADDQKRAIAQRKERVALWKGKMAEDTFVGWADDESEPVTFTYGELGRFAESVWSDGKGNYYPVEYVHNSCIRRGYAAIASAYAWTKRNPKRKLSDFIIPFTVREYPKGSEGELQRMDDRVLENVLHGRVGYNPADMLTLAFKYVALAALSESQLARRLNIKRGTAQKFHKLALLARRHSKLKIVERCHMSPPKAEDGTPNYQPHGAILLGSIRQQDLACLLGASAGQEQPTATPITTKAMGKKHGPATDESVEKYFKLLYAGRTNEDKVMPKTTIDTLISSLVGVKDDTAEIVRTVLEGVRRNDASAITTLVPVPMPEDGMEEAPKAHAKSK